MLNLTYTSDPSHGYLAVPIDTFRTLDVYLSEYSFRDAKFVYAEEDFDMPAIIAAMLEHSVGHYIREVSIDTPHPCRTLRRC